MLARQLMAALAAGKKSIFLLGPRQTGKSTLVGQLKLDVVFNLAQESTYLDFLRDPRLLEERLAVVNPASTVFIDEIQRLPSLLNTIQTILDKPSNKFKFYLTGSSARKLKRGHANLLPGRVHTFYLGPLTSGELSYSLDTRRALSIGTLPGLWTDTDSKNQEKTLRSYAATYLKEEIQAENLARNLEGFVRFLQVSAEWAGSHLDLAKMSSAAQVARQSAVRFFEILEDSLIVFRLDSFSKSLTRRLVQHPKYYFFDVGVRNGLLSDFSTSSDRIGGLFEHLVVTQLYHSAHHADVDARFFSYRTEHGAEVDVILEFQNQLFAIEIKASRNLGAHDLTGLKSFSNYVGKKHRLLVFYLGEYKRKIDGVEIFPWQEGLKAIGL